MSVPVQMRSPLVAAAIALLLASAPACAQEETTANILGRHVGAGVEGLSEFGKVSGTLVHISSGKFGGLTGSQSRGVARRMERAFEPWRNASAAIRASLGLSVATRVLTVTDYATSSLAPALEGDYRGAVSGAVQVAVAPTVISAGTAVFGAIGAVIGSAIPVVGTTFGGVVGGAIGKVAGGYLSSFAYDKWIKSWVGESVEAGISGAEGLIDIGIAGLYDRGALHEAMLGRNEFLYNLTIAEREALWNEVLRAPGIGSSDTVELTGPEQTPYIVLPKEPVAPPPVEIAVVPEVPVAPPPDETADGLLAGATTFTLSVLNTGNPRRPSMNLWMVCTLDDEQVECSSPSDATATLSGVLTGNTIDAQARSYFEWDFLGEGYTGESAGQVTIVLEPGGTATVSETGYFTVLTQWGKSDLGPGWPYDSNRAGEWLPY